jgi:hypothetical protein
VYKDDMVVEKNPSSQDRWGDEEEVVDVIACDKSRNWSDYCGGRTIEHEDDPKRYAMTT